MIRFQIEYTFPAGEKYRTHKFFPVLEKKGEGNLLPPLIQTQNKKIYVYRFFLQGTIISYKSAGGTFSKLHEIPFHYTRGICENINLYKLNSPFSLFIFRMIR